MPSASGHPQKPTKVGPLDKRIGYRLRLANMALLELANPAFRKLGLRPTEYGILLFLKFAPDSRQMEIAEAMCIKRPNLVGMIKRLEGGGLVQRRLAGLRLTKRGETRLRQAELVHGRIDKQLDQKLGIGGRRQLLDLLRKFI